jgi:chromosome segregation ATPase
MSTDSGGTGSGSSVEERIAEAERRLVAAAEVAGRAERRATAEIEALEADLAKVRAEAEAEREQLRLRHEEELQKEREAKDKAITTAEERLNEIEAQADAAEERMQEAERRAVAAENAIADERARARDGAAAWLREQLETLRREAEGR